MPTDNSIFERCVLRRVGRGRSRGLWRQARKCITVPAGQRPDHADESVAMLNAEKRRFQLGERLAKSFEPISRGAAYRSRERPRKGRIGINVAGPGIDIPYREIPESRFDPDRQPVAVLIVEHLVGLRGTDPGCRGGYKKR